MAMDLGCTSHSSDVLQVTGVQNPELLYMQDKCDIWSDSHDIFTGSEGVESIVVFQGVFQGLGRDLLFNHLCLQSLVGEMDVPKVLSKYNLLALILSDLERLSCCNFWRIYLVEVDYPLIFGVSLG